MTNTRITDPEILERRYPVLLHQFSLRPGSGGEGVYSGGNGVIREMEFQVPLQVSILSERRVHRPFGMDGGGSGQPGLNLVIKKQAHRSMNLGGKNSIWVGPGDRIRIETPGGGGWGVSNRSSR
jgi:5-oxoprolinase (ATP-hydrolysing)